MPLIWAFLKDLRNLDEELDEATQGGGGHLSQLVSATGQEAAVQLDV